MISSWLVKNTRWAVVITAGVFLIYYQTREVFSCIAGAVVTASTAKIFKIIIKQPRPNQNSNTPSSILGIFTDSSDYGMPSSHTSSLAYFATYFTLLGWAWYLIPIWVFAIISASSRVYYKYHTVSQILAGFVLGVFGANLCYTVFHQV